MLKRIGAVALVAACALAGPAHAQDDDGGWTYSIVPSVWMVEYDGTLANRPNLVDASFDTFDSPEYAIGMLFDARRRRIGFYADITYVGLRQDEERQFGGTPFAASAIDIKSYDGALAAYLRFIDIDWLAADIVGGVRLTSLDVTAKAALFDETAQLEIDQLWSDPILGLRVILGPDSDFGIEASGEYGGLGASSEELWRAQALVRYQFFENTSASIGYRGSQIEFVEEEFIYDVEATGPFIGAQIRF